jgi:hypothetical protein
VENAAGFGERDSLEPLIYFAGAYRGIGKNL